MIVKALKDFDCPSHRVPKGGIADLPVRVARPAIEAGLLEESSIAEKLKQSETRETRRRKPNAASKLQHES